jgi:serine phosphatase RsbU (regulator of sigma subunit)
MKGDKQPIGNFMDEETPEFTNQEIHLLPNDRIYLFSDGYADQFGGPNGKKLKYSRFQELLIENKDKPMQDQKNYLGKTFEDWRGDLEQIDDICVIGVSV